MLMDSRHVTVADGVDLAVYDWGGVGGLPFLLVHGLASNARMWDGVARRLVAAGHRAVAVDLRGHGRSSKPDTGYDMADVADEIQTLCDRLGLDRPVVAGQSWGGNLVIELAARHPEVIRGIVPVDGGFFHLADRFPDWDDCAREMAPPKLVGTPRGRIEAAIRSVNRHWPPEAVDGVLANFEIRTDDTIAPWLTFERHMLVLRGLWEHHPRHRYGEIETPVLWMPAHDGTTTRTSKHTSIDEAQQLLSRSRVEWFSPGHHDLHAEQPDRVVKILVDAVADGFFGDLT